MENSTETRPINVTKINLEMELQRAFQMRKSINDTSNTQGYNPNDTSYKSEENLLDGIPNSIPMVDVDYGYNREVRRYAKKHNLSCEKAFKRLYK